MSRRSRPVFVGLLTLVGLAGCSSYVRDDRPAWRAQAENACLARGIVQESSYIRPARELNGPGICGLTHPFKVTALSDGSVTLNSTQTLDCPMIEALDTWIKDVVQPAAMARFGEKVVRINSMGSYNCRGINNMSGANLSEHSFGNAIDVGGFVLASGRELNIMRGFNGSDPQESAFLHEAHAGACSTFTTVLGPGYNIFHYNHFHVDLAMHGSTSHGMRRYCKPVPQTNLPGPPRKDDLPDPPPIEEEMDIARAPVPPPAVGVSTLVASVPPPLPMRSAAPPPLRQTVAVVPRSDLSSPRLRPAAPSPLISFATSEPEPDLPPPTVRRVEARPRAPLALDPADGRAPPADVPPASEAAPDPDSGMGTAPPDSEPSRAEGEPDVAPRPRPRPAEGGPADWDVTSSTRH